MVDGEEGNDSETDIEALRITRRESRTVLDHQISLLNDLDDKAMRTTRTSILLFGILISAAGIIGIEELATLPWYVQVLQVLGATGLFLTSIAGIITYSVSDVTFGLSGTHRREVRDETYTEREWLFLLSEEYDEWTDEMKFVNWKNARFVTLTQYLLGGSMLALFLATALLLLSA